MVVFSPTKDSIYNLIHQNVEPKMKDVWKWRLAFRWLFKLPRISHLILQQSFWTEIMKLSISSSWHILISSNVLSPENVKVKFVKHCLSFLEQCLAHAKWNQLLTSFSGVSSFYTILTRSAEGRGPSSSGDGSQELWDSSALDFSAPRSCCRATVTEILSWFIFL